MVKQVGFAILTGNTFNPNMFETRERAQKHLDFWDMNQHRNASIIVEVHMDADALTTWVDLMGPYVPAEVAARIAADG
jgi:hypothetical protein